MNSLRTKISNPHRYGRVTMAWMKILAHSCRLESTLRLVGSS